MLLDLHLRLVFFPYEMGAPVPELVLPDRRIIEVDVWPVNAPRHLPGLARRPQERVDRHDLDVGEETAQPDCEIAAETGSDHANGPAGSPVLQVPQQMD